MRALAKPRAVANLTRGESCGEAVGRTLSMRRWATDRTESGDGVKGGERGRSKKNQKEKVELDAGEEVAWA